MICHIYEFDGSRCYNKKKGGGIIPTDVLIVALIVLVSLLVTAWLAFQLGRRSGMREAEIKRPYGDLEQRFSALQEAVSGQLAANREEMSRASATASDRAVTAVNGLRDAISQSFREGRSEQSETLSRFGDSLSRSLDDMSKALSDIRQVSSEGSKDMQVAVSDGLRVAQASQHEKLDQLQRTILDSVGSRLDQIRESNDRQLEKMRETVDEKLQKTLNERLAVSFGEVTAQLQSVGQGLGEMRALAEDAKSLKNALTNVKARGTYGEVRCERLLADILSPSQYELNAQIKPGCFVEFAVKLPGNGDGPVLLPIDSKFPIEDYNRLLDATDRASIDTARKGLKNKIRAFAKDIRDKYVEPPKTTDFALMFLPTEGLYAEVVQDAALFEELRVKYGVTPVGAVTLSAFLSSLQIGFRTLAIEQRAQGVQTVLEAVKTEIGKFGGMLEKAQKQVQQADATLSTLSGTRLNAINRKLRSFDGLPEHDANDVLGITAGDVQS